QILHTHRLIPQTTNIRQGLRKPATLTHLFLVQFLKLSDVLYHVVGIELVAALFGGLTILCRARRPNAAMDFPSASLPGWSTYIDNSTSNRKSTRLNSSH